MPPKRQRKDRSLDPLRLDDGRRGHHVVTHFWIMIITSFENLNRKFLSGGGFSWAQFGRTLNLRHTDWTRGPQLNDRLLVVDTHHFVRWDSPAGFAFSKIALPDVDRGVFRHRERDDGSAASRSLMPEFVNVTKLGLTGG